MIFQFQEGHSFFHRLDPLSKFIWLLCVSVIALSSEQAISQTVLLMLVILIGAVWVQLPWRTIWRGIRIPFWFGVPYFVLQLLFLPGQTEIFSFGSYTLTAEALDYAVAVTERLLTLVLASFLYIVTTDPRDVVLAMAQKLRIPYRFAFAVSIALRFLPILEAETQLLRSAQRLRGGDPKGLREKLEWNKRFAFSVFTAAVRHVQQTAEAMENKAFGAARERTYRRQINVPRSGIILSAGSVLLTSIVLGFFIF